MKLTTRQFGVQPVQTIILSNQQHGEFIMFKILLLGNLNGLEIRHFTKIANFFMANMSSKPWCQTNFTLKKKLSHLKFVHFATVNRKQ